MSDPEALEGRVSDLTRTGRLPLQEALRVVNEVLSFLAETPGIAHTRWATHGERLDQVVRAALQGLRSFASTS